MSNVRSERWTPWILKAAVQGITSRLPGGAQVNTLLQRHVTGTLKLDEKRVRGKFDRCHRHLEHYGRHWRRESAGARVLELGTGWFPIAPVGFALCGADSVWALDNVSHLWPEHVFATLRMLSEMARRGELRGTRPDRLAKVERVVAAPRERAEAMLAEVGVKNVVGDARTFVPESDVDLIASNNTLEHVPPEVLYEIFAHWRKVAKPGTVMSHWIDLSDHYASFDASIGPYNFLKFSSPVWRLFNNPHQYQNRMRISDFRRLHEATGWQIVEEDSTAGSIDELRNIDLADEFRRYCPEDLLVYESWIVSKAV